MILIIIDKINPEWLTFKGYYAATPIGKSPAQCIKLIDTIQLTEEEVS